LHSTISRSLEATLVVFLVGGTSACAVPLFPGYRILQESTQVAFVSGQAPELRIRVQSKMQNSGSSDLTFVDVNFPEERSFGRKNLRIQIDGRETGAAPLPAEYSEELPSALRIAFDPPWVRKQNREFSIEYSLLAPENSGAGITLDPYSFHLGARGWLPEFQPPKNLLASYPSRPDISDYTVRVPADFLVLARGTPKGKRQDGDQREYRFELKKADLEPFVIAGRYVAAPQDPHAAIFWTTQPLKDDPGPAVEQITAAWNALQTAFGQLDKNVAAPHIVESPSLQERFSEPGPVAAAFPGGALVNPAALGLGTSNAQFVEMVDHALARNWFGNQMYFQPDAALGMGEGLPEYASIVIDEARNGSAAAGARVLQYLRRYNNARSYGSETPLGNTLLTDPVAQRRIALAKAPLFFVALEDTCGETQMRSGLAHLLAASRGQEVGYAALRSALEQSSNRNLAKMFRFWLNETGLPQDFLDRYRLTASHPEIGQ